MWLRNVIETAFAKSTGLPVLNHRSCDIKLVDSARKVQDHYDSVAFSPPGYFVLESISQHPGVLFLGYAVYAALGCHDLSSINQS